MWTPSQWAVAFPAVTALMGLMCVVLVIAKLADSSAAAAVAGGGMAGLLASIAWTIRPLIAPIAALPAFGAVLALVAVWLAVPQSVAAATVIASCLFAIWVLGYHGLYTGTITRAVAAAPEAIGPPDAARRALIVYLPGRSGRLHSLLQDVAGALTDAEWSVEMITAHRRSRADTEPFSLVILAAPTYNFRAAQPLLTHLRRLESFAGRPVVLILTGGGMTDAALHHLCGAVERREGRIVAAFEVWTQRPSAERYGLEKPSEFIRRALAGLSLR